MNQILRRLSYANVMSSIAVFLVIGGGAAFAALSKNSVGPKQLKKNAVRTAKIKGGAVTFKKLHKNAVRTGKVKNGAIATNKLKDGAVTDGKIAAGTITGGKINAPSTPFSQITDRLRGSVSLPFTGGQIYPFNNPTYSQPAGRTDQYVGSVQVHFPASCTAPRQAQAWLLIDAENPAAPTPYDIAGQAGVLDRGAGAVTRQMDFTPFPGSYRGLSTQAPSAQTSHKFDIFMLGFSCSAGAGVTAVGSGLDVIGTN